MSIVYMTIQQVQHYVDVCLSLCSKKLQYRIISITHCDNNDIYFGWRGNNNMIYINRICHEAGINTSALYECETYNDMLDILCVLRYNRRVKSKHHCNNGTSIKDKVDLK